MSRFSNNWSKNTQSEKSGLGKRLRRNINPPMPLKPMMEKAVLSIKTQLLKLDGLLFKLNEKDVTLVNRITLSIQ